MPTSLQIRPGAIIIFFVFSLALVLPVVHNKKRSPITSDTTVDKGAPDKNTKTSNRNLPQDEQTDSVRTATSYFEKKKETWLLGEFEGRWATRRQGGEWGTDAWDGARTGVSERFALEGGLYEDAQP